MTTRYDSDHVWVTERKARTAHFCDWCRRSHLPLALCGHACAPHVPADDASLPSCGTCARLSPSPLSPAKEATKP